MIRGGISIVALCITAAVSVSACSSNGNDGASPMDQVTTTLPDENLSEAAKVFLDNRDFAAAERAYRQILSVESENADAKLGIAESLLGQAKIDKAHSSYVDLATNPELRARALQGMGLTDFRQGNLEAAQAAFLAATLEDPDLWRSWNGLAQVHDLKAEWVKAHESYLKALETTPEKAIIYNNMGMSYLAQNDFTSAVSAFEEAFRHDPKMSTAMNNRRLALAKQGNYDEATFDIKPSSEARALNNAGYVALLQGDFQAAEAFFIKALRLSPNFYAKAYENLQLLERMRGEAANPSSPS